MAKKMQCRSKANMVVVIGALALGATVAFWYAKGLIDTSA